MSNQPHDYKATELTPAENRLRIRRWLRGIAWIIGALVIMCACLVLVTAPIELNPDYEPNQPSSSVQRS